MIFLSLNIGRLAVLLALATVVGPISVGLAQDVAYPASFDEPVPLYAVGLGPLTWPITTNSDDAQAFFDQGMQFMYAFTPMDAARSFVEAQKRDPDCAMCFFGEAWAWGPYFNGPMRSANAPRAFGAIQNAKRLAPKATRLEQALIDAMAIRFTEVHDPDTRRELDEAYSAAMAEVWEAFPQDQIVGTFYGESLMLLQPRRGTWDIDNPEIQQIHRVLEAALAIDITHPGACHLYVHATESTTAPGKAQACADHLGSAIPGASHINHMPSHTYNRVGRWDEAVQANVQAWHSDLKAEVGEGFAIYPSHNLHMLLFAASMGGQGALANQAAKDYAKLVRDGQFYQALTLVRFGRFDELLDLHDPPENLILKGLWEFGRGYAHLRVGDRDSARIYAEHVEEAATTVPNSILFRGHTAASLLGVTGGILRAEIQASEGQYDEAVVTLEHAIELEDGLRYDEPEPLNFSARHWLGALLLDLDRPADAERVYRLALEDHPHNGWSLFGLERALLAQGREAEANRVRDEFNEVWARADVWIRSSRF